MQGIFFDTSALVPVATEQLPNHAGAPKFVDYGQNMEHSPDGKAYLLGMGAVVDDPMPRPAITKGPEGTVYVEDPAANPVLQISLRSGEQAYFLNSPSKFISQDGRSLWLSYSANFSSDWNGVDLKIPPPPGGRYGLSLHELKLLGPDDARSE